MKSILTTITAATSLGLTTLAVAKAHLGITNTASDIKIEQWIAQASAMITSRSGRVLAYESVRQTFFIDSGIDAIPLARFPVSAVSSIEFNGEALSAEKYTLDQKSGMIYRVCGNQIHDWCPGKLVVTYGGGYVLPDSVPVDLQRAALVMISHAKSSDSRDPKAKRIEVPDVQTVDYWVGSVNGTTDLPQDVVALINPYIDYRVA